MFDFIYCWRLKVRLKKELQLLDQKRDIWLEGEISHNEYMGCLKASVLVIREELAKIKLRGGGCDETDRCIAFLDLLKARNFEVVEKINAGWGK